MSDDLDYCKRCCAKTVRLLYKRLKNQRSVPYYQCGICGQAQTIEGKYISVENIR